jgi:hypothetical protein
MKKLVVHFDREPCDVYIGRPSRWGNPFRLGPDGDRAEVLLLYEVWLQSRPDLIEEACRVLRGKVLGCWCDPMTCHGDILARIANNWQLALPLLLNEE